MVSQSELSIVFAADSHLITGEHPKDIEVSVGSEAETFLLTGDHSRHKRPMADTCNTI